MTIQELARPQASTHRGDEDRIHAAFHLSLILKALSAVLETIAGIALLVITPDQLHSVAISLINALTSSPVSTQLSNMVDSHFNTFLAHGLRFAIIYLLSHGLVKLVLVVAVYRDHAWAYPGLMVALVGFIIYQCWHMVAISFGFGMLALTIFDVVVLWLTWKEYQRKKNAVSVAAE